MTTLKAMTASLALLVGASTLGLGQASAAPQGNLNANAPGSNVELVQMKKWKYDRKRHGERRSKRDRDHRFSFGGFWYAAPFWGFTTAPLYRDRLSCWAARRIVDRRYDWVRTIECNGRVYTFAAVNYRGKRVRVSVNSNTGAHWRS